MWTELHHTLGCFALGTPVGSLAPGERQLKKNLACPKHSSFTAPPGCGLLITVS